MSKLGRDLIERYRTATALSPEERADALRQLERRLGSGEPLRTEFDVPPPELRRGWALWGASRWFAVLAVVGLGGAALLLQRPMLEPERPAPPRVETASAAVRQAPHAAPTTVARTIEPQPSAAVRSGSPRPPEIAGVRRPTARAQHAPPSDRGEPSTVERAVAAPPSDVGQSDQPNGPAVPSSGSVPERAEPRRPTNTLADEVVLLEAARAAQRRGDPKRALAILAEHSWHFPTGQLAEEREVARILALCADGRTHQARTRAQKFLHTHQQSPFAARVRASCVGTP